MFVGFFFFSSRRRHTRWPRDWSSDVCSSDLAVPPVGSAGSYLCLGSRDATARTLGFWPKFEIESRSVPSLLGDDARRLKDPALEDERVVVRRVIRSSQFHASDPPLDVRVVDALHLRMDDSIAQILLAVLPEVLAARFHLAYEDRRRLQIADPLE